MRVVEILGGDPHWDRRTVMTDSFCHYQPLNRVLNTQMIIDWPATAGDGGETYLTIPRPVLQRMIDGRPLGIAVKALGALHASFYAQEDGGGRNAARLLFNLGNRQLEAPLGAEHRAADAGQWCRGPGVGPA